MPADVNCQVCFYYKITRVDSFFDRDKHRRIVSLDLSLSKSIFVAGQAVRGKSSSLSLSREILKERHIFMETRNIKVGGGDIASRLLELRFRKLAVESKGEKERGRGSNREDGGAVLTVVSV